MNTGFWLVLVVGFLTFENIIIMFMMYRRLLNQDAAPTRRSTNLKE